MRTIIRIENNWHELKTKLSLFEVLRPQGFVNSESIIPEVGDIIIAPSDVRGVDRQSVEQDKKYLPDGLTLSEPTGLDNDVYYVIGE